MNKTICIFCLLIARSVLGLCQGDTSMHEAKVLNETNNTTGFNRESKNEEDRNKKEYKNSSNTLEEPGFFSKQSVSKEGFVVYNYESGHKKEQGNYEHNLKTGKWEGYYDTTGKIWYIANYKEGKRDGELVSYYKNGKIKRIKQGPIP